MLWILRSLAHHLPWGRAVQAESNAAKVPVLKISIPKPIWGELSHLCVAIAAPGRAVSSVKR